MAGLGDELGASPTSALTYQGQLQQGGGAANGTFDFQFSLWNGAADGTQVGAPQTLMFMAVTNGLFTVNLDFGSSVFDGSDRWLEIAVRTNGSLDGWTVLSPRQPILSTPYAVLAQSANNLVGAVPSASLTGTYNSQVVLNNASNQFVGAFMGDAIGLTNLPTPGTNFSGLRVTNTLTGSNAMLGRIEIPNGTASLVLTTNSNVGLGLVSSNSQAYVGLALHTNEALLRAGYRMGGIWYEPGHSGGQGGELHVTSLGSISVNAGQGGTGGRIHLGSTGGRGQWTDFQHDFEGHSAFSMWITRDGSVGARAWTNGSGSGPYWAFYNPAPYYANGTYPGFWNFANAREIFRVTTNAVILSAGTFLIGDGSRLTGVMTNNTTGVAAGASNYLGAITGNGPLVAANSPVISGAASITADVFKPNRVVPLALGGPGGTNVLRLDLTNNSFHLLLTTNAYFDTPGTLSAGQEFTLWVNQDGEGGRAVSFNLATWKFSGGIVPGPTVYANGLDIYRCVVGPFGTNVYVTQTPNLQ